MRLPIQEYRSGLMRSCVAYVLMLQLSVAAVWAAAAKPNVIFILTDDHGYGDLGCYGAKDIETPVIDGIAKRGIRFSQFYASAPVCCPSRAGVLSGKYPWLVGVSGNIGLQSEGMPSEHKTMAEYFREAGYTTAHLGKWHMGNFPETLPNGQGFDYSFGHHGGCIDNYSHYFYWNGPNKHDLFENGKEVFHPGEYFPDLMVKKALDFTVKAEKPFFIYYAMNLPHYPYQAPNKWIEKYKNLKMPRKLYAAAVSAVDESLGEMLKGLRNQGQLDNTIVVFMSDHGHSTEIRAFGGGGHAGGLRGAKFSLFEGGIRVPAIISYPLKCAEGESRNAMAVASDWLPTLLDLCEIKYQPDSFTGKSLKMILLGEDKTPHDYIVWQDGQQRAVRQGYWKLIENPYDTTKGANRHAKSITGYRLYNLRDDRAERNDLSSKYPKRVDELKRLLP